jgi:hypothetical protein
MVRRSCSSDEQKLPSSSESGGLADQMVEAATAALDIGPVDPDSATYRAPTPFHWQSGLQLILVDEDPDDFWVLAELQFDPELCRYNEMHRASYLWFREALGAAMSRALASGEDASEEMAIHLLAWYETHHASALATESR